MACPALKGNLDQRTFSLSAQENMRRCQFYLPSISLNLLIKHRMCSHAAARSAWPFPPAAGGEFTQPRAQLFRPSLYMFLNYLVVNFSCVLHHDYVDLEDDCEFQLKTGVKHCTYTPYHQLCIVSDFKRTDRTLHIFISGRSYR